jgi:hypothetical protein
MECYGLREEATHTHSIIFAIIWLFQIVSYLLTRAKGGKRGGGKEKNLVCMILLLIYVLYHTD